MTIKNKERYKDFIPNGLFAVTGDSDSRGLLDRSRLRRYIIWRRVEMTDNWVKVTTVEHFITKTVIDKLEFEKNFFFAVSADNDVGESDKAVTREPVRLAKPSGRCSVLWNESKLFFFFEGGHFVKIHKLILIMLYVKYCGNIFICGGQCPWVAKYTKCFPSYLFYREVQTYLLKCL